MEIIDTLGFPVFKGNLFDIDVQNKKKFLINTISPNSYGLAVNDAKTEQALKNSDILILDGVYFGWASIILKGKKINRITGWDAFIHFAKWANDNHGRVFFLGSTNETLGKIEKRFVEEYPNVRVGTYSPPYKEEFLMEDNVLMQQKINDFKPDIIFIGLTAPKQEKWGYANKPYLDVKVICTVGNVFDWYAGNSKRPNVIWQKLGLEWLVRIFIRPEIFKRNIKNQMTFFLHLILIIFKIKKTC